MSPSMILPPRKSTPPKNRCKDAMKRSSWRRQPIHQLGNDVRKQNEGLKRSDDGRDDILQRATHGKITPLNG
ncbi:hypothetical protein CEXT_700461 [Caerostris extrusa]|uniref:Ribosomal protein L32 n=1 Tax=Caerostris extrusa TaxID=172846 RepID=A0AAV4RWL7_CAEEX|nr:hypothetical protein CEXT_700461 [Caerostris extrusa]